MTRKIPRKNRKRKRTKRVISRPPIFNDKLKKSYTFRFYFAHDINPTDYIFVKERITMT